VTQDLDQRRPVGKYGMRAPAPGVRWKLRMGDYVDTTSLPPIPKGAFGHMDSVKVPWGMLKNDELGCCVISGAEHEHMLWNAEAGKPIPQFGDKSTVTNYEKLAGYVPGNPDTDQGTDMVAAAHKRITQGIVDEQGKRHYLGIALELDCGPGYLNMTQLWYAAWLFDGLGLGILVTPEWEDDFAVGKPWDASDYNPNNIAGGHYVPLMAREVDTLHGPSSTVYNADIVTWGAKQAVTIPGLKVCTTTVLAYASQEKLNNGKDIDGLSWSDMRSDIKRIAKM
jgi:hypothetical protein